MVIDAAKDRADKLADNFSVPAVYDLSRPSTDDVDAVHVCVPSIHAKLGTMVAGG